MQPTLATAGEPAMLRLRGVAQNNLRHFNLDLPHGKLIVVTGVSGSGKSSLAFDTLFAEGQRRYVECLSSYARQFVERMDRPKVDEISGILPSVALRQGKTIRAARSTVASLTELSELFRPVFAQASSPVCPECGQAVRRATPAELAAELVAAAPGRRAAITFELPVVSTAAARAALEGLAAAGYHRCFEAGKTLALAEVLGVDRIGSALAVLQDRLAIDAAELSRLADSLRQALLRGGGVASVHVEGEALPGGAWQLRGTAGGFVELRATSQRRCVACRTPVADPSPQLFSSSSSLGACPTCNGFGRIADIDLDRVVPDTSLSLAGGAIRPWTTEATDDERDALLRFCERQAIATDTAWRELPAEHRQLILDGMHKGPAGTRFRGVRGWFRWLEGKTYKMHVRVLLSRYRGYRTCQACQGTRLRSEARAWRLAELDLPGWLELPLEAVLARLAGLDLEPAVAQAIELPLRELHKRVEFLVEIGLGYLSADRSARTLSGGELQRVQLVAALATGLSQVLYVLDEPSIGLHARDNDRLLRLLQRLTAAGNSVVVVEHDPALILAADHLVDLGPGAGQDGGQLLFSGPPAELRAGQGSLTAEYLLGNLRVEPPVLAAPLARARSKPKGTLTIAAPTARNLRGQDVHLQLGALNAVCGVSGSGKSTLVEDVLYRGLLRARGEPTDEPGACAGLLGAEAIRQVVLVDQEMPPGSNRANCATYLKIWDVIRARLAAEPLGVQRGYTPATFSFNREGGRCPACEGLGVETVDMQFLSDVQTTCELCEGKRFSAATLQVRHRGLDAAAFLDRTAAELAEMFSDDASLAGPARALAELGLGYLRLGQPLSTLSGGELQRVKIAWHLLQARTSNALFLLDEPSTGLHLHDVAVLLAALRRLVAAGNTVVLVEHQLDLLDAADHLVELGPDGGPRGGHVLYQGPPDGLRALLDSPTGRFLRQYKRDHRYAATPGLGDDNVERDPGCIQVRGARVHNLRNLDLDLPRDRLTVVTGLSGSGKSSLAFDLVFAEGQRRFLDCLSPYARQYLPPASAPDVDRLTGLPPTVAIAQRTTRGGLRSTVATLTDLLPYLRLLYARCGNQQCPHCGGAVSGQSAAAVAASLAERYRGALAVYVTAPAVRGRKGHHRDIVEKARQLGHSWVHIDGSLCALTAVPPLRRFAAHDIDWVVARLTPAQLADQELVAQVVEAALALGDGTIGSRTASEPLQPWSLRRHCSRCERSVEAPDPRWFSFTSPVGWCARCEGTGVYRDPPAAKKRRGHEADGRSTEDLAKAGLPDGGETVQTDAERHQQACPQCHGRRLKPHAESVTLAGLPLPAVLDLGPAQLLDWLAGLRFSGALQQTYAALLPELRSKCELMLRLGLDYLALSRGAVTLSGGESQRLRLAAQLASNLRGALYVLDEPTIGLHPEDNQLVLTAMRELVARGNGLLVVEHDEETIRRADHLVELGPSGGREGGQILYQGDLAGLLACPNSPTGMALLQAGALHVASVRPVGPEQPRLTVRGARRNNLIEVTANFVRGRFNVVTGVSGSGKSTLVRDLLVPLGNLGLTARERRPEVFAGNAELAGIDGLETLGRIVEIDQSPIGRTSRSCPATYMGIFDSLRQVFAQQPSAKMAGLDAAAFSYNLEAGRCPACQGT
ncbi:MAG: excinuclease ABC subunit UvrA, partial [Deltaproteobacteria bacterium]|nr:excinuclease ABC subunit UvrA [Deltaproteobacteria bacterium]